MNGWWTLPRRSSSLLRIEVLGQPVDDPRGEVTGTGANLKHTYVAGALSAGSAKVFDEAIPNAGMSRACVNRALGTQVIRIGIAHSGADGKERFWR